jgi:hypothetical protein
MQKSLAAKNKRLAPLRLIARLALLAFGSQQVGAPGSAAVQLH